MARIGGRNLAFSWIVGLLCVVVIVALFWFALPIIPAMASFVGVALHVTPS